MAFSACNPGTAGFLQKILIGMIQHLRLKVVGSGLLNQAIGHVGCVDELWCPGVRQSSGTTLRRHTHGVEPSGGSGYQLLLLDVVYQHLVLHSLHDGIHIVCVRVVWSAVYHHLVVAQLSKQGFGGCGPWSA